VNWECYVKFVCSVSVTSGKSVCSVILRCVKFVCFVGERSVPQASFQISCESS
jgi:hypothetical protein